MASPQLAGSHPRIAPATSEAHSVIRQIPDYLRLHTAESLESRGRGQRPQADPRETFWRTFAEATGWAVVSAPRGNDVRLRSTIVGDGIMSAEDMLDAPAVSHASAQNLALAATRLMKHLRDAETTLRRTEAVKATVEAAPVAPDPALDPTTADELAKRLEEILADAAKACDCYAAGLYMLDESTSELKLRVGHGLDSSLLAAPARELRGSLADLEALVGGVVQVDCIAPDADASALEGMTTAICVAINVADTPVGTLWIWSDMPREFTSAHKAAAKLAGRLLAHELIADLQRQRSRKATKAIKPLKAASSWQERQQPAAVSPAPGWHVSGWTQTPLALASSWFHWDVLPNGMLALVIAEAKGRGYDGAMIAATARAAWQAHAGYRHDPAQVLRRIGDTLWETNTGDQIVSLAYAQLDPDTGEGEIAAAGDVSGIVASAYGFRPLLELSQPLGASIETRPLRRPLRIAPGELLLAYTPGLVQAVGQPGDAEQLSQHRLAQLVRGGDVCDVESVMARLRREAAQIRQATTDRTVVAISRSLIQP